MHRHFAPTSLFLLGVGLLSGCSDKNGTPSGDTADTETGSSATSDTETGDVTDSGHGLCGNGQLDPEEICDDSNYQTEIGEVVENQTTLSYAPEDCMGQCQMVLAKCGNGMLDDGEQCDDGDQDSYDDCTTSCTLNIIKGAHSPCQRDCTNALCSTDISAGTIMPGHCADLVVPQGAQKVCFDSTDLSVAERYFAEGECLAAAQKCTGSMLCPPDVGNVEQLTSCPAGTQLITRITENTDLNLEVTTKVCHKTCERDDECRWNAFDDLPTRMSAGQYRCQTTPDSKGVKICADARN